MKSPESIPAFEHPTQDELLKAIYKPEDLYWQFQKYKIICRTSGAIQKDFYESEERIALVLRARRQFAECMLIALIYPEASWNHPGKTTDII